MEECVILSDGDKLKQLRRKYCLKQEEITGNEITRNLISEIETNRANITKKTAEVIIRNLNLLSKKKNFEFTETVEYLMENQIVQAANVLDDYIKKLEVLSISKDGSFIELLKKAENFLIDWDIKDKKLKIYELAGDYYCNRNEMYQSIVYYEKGLALVSKMSLDKELLPLLRKLSAVYIYTAKYNLSIECCTFALNYFPNMPNGHKDVFLHNRALGYRALKSFDLALQDICDLENIVVRTNTLRYFETLNLKAICLKSKDEFKYALEVYNSMLNLLNDDNFKERIIVLINITRVYMHVKDNDRVIKEFNNITELLFKINNDNDYITDIYFEVGDIYKYLNNTVEAEKYYTKALKSAKLKREYVIESNILCALIDIYTEVQDDEKMDKLRFEFFNLSNNQLSINNVIMCKLINFYNEKSCIEKIREISNFVLQFNT